MNMFYRCIGKGLLMREKLAPSAISYFFRAKSPMDVQEESSQFSMYFLPMYLLSTRANPANVLDAEVQVRAVSREQLGRRIDVCAGEIDGSSCFGCAGRN